MADPTGEVRVLGKGLILREWTEADLPAMVELFNNPEVARWTPLASPFDLRAAESYLDSGRADPGRLHLAITTDGRQPLDLITAYAHKTLGLARVIAEIEPGNVTSQAVARRAGYRLASDEPGTVAGRGGEVTVFTWEHLA